MYYIVVKNYSGDVDYGVHEKIEIVHITTDFEEAKKYVENYTIPITDINPSNISYKTIADRPYFSYECEGATGMLKLCDGYTVYVDIMDIENDANDLTVFEVLYLE